MKKLLLATLATGVVATSFVTPAYAAHGPDGRKCAYNSSTDPNPEAPPETMTGQINAGPLAGSGTVTCIIQVDNQFHSGPNVVSAVASGTDVVVLSPTLVSYNSPENSQDYLCTQWTNADGSGTVYWDVPSGTWSHDPNTAQCGAATQVSTGPAIDLLNETLFEPLDALIICPLLVTAANTVPVGTGPADPLWLDPEDGDVYVLGDRFWDCPTYGDLD